MERRADGAGRADPAAALVPDPSVEDVLLGAHGDRAAPGAGGEEAAGAQSARRRRARAVPAAAASRVPSARRTRTGIWSAFFGALDVAAQALSSRSGRRGCARRAIDECVRLDDRAAERRGRPGRHLSRHGQQRDDVRRAGLCRRPSAPRHRAQVGGEAARRQGRRSLLPALRLAGVGHGAGLPRADGGAATRRPTPAVARGLEWLKPLQVLDVKGDWAEERPDVRPGGWAFQYNNAYYPDLDDTAVVVMALDRAARAGAGARLRRGDRARPRMGRSACRAGTAAGPIGSGAQWIARS